MTKIIWITIVFALLGFQNARSDSEVSKFKTQYPSHTSDPSGFLFNDNAQVKLGYPDSTGAKIWVKGSPVFNKFQVNANGKSIVNDVLHPPHFTKLVEGLSVNTNHNIIFNSNDSSLYKTILTNSLDDLINPGNSYSVAFYGCVQPFSVQKDGDEFQSIVFNTENDFPKRFLRTFSNAVSQSGSEKVNGLLPNPKLLIGTGDQVYMDAGYESLSADGKVAHPLSAWTTDRFQSKLLRTEMGFKDHVEKTYRAFGSLVDLNMAQQAVSQVNVWDDHEIRDGWGSQEDEYLSDGVTLNEDFGHVFNTAKEGFIDHQLLSGPRSSQANSLKNNLKTMHQTFQVGKYKGFAFDLRTARNSKSNRVLGAEQLQDFDSWLKKEVNDGQEILLISSMPVFLANHPFGESLSKAAMKDSKDDLNDGWGSEFNKKERNNLLSILLKARIDRDIKPIFVSGDYHKGAISEIWYGEDSDCYKEGEKNKKVFGYELLASGLIHEGIVDDYKALAFDKIESQRLGKHFIRELKILGKPRSYCLDPFVKMSVVQENFGGLEVRGDKNDLLKLIAGNGKDNTADVFYLPLDWEKDFDPDVEKTYEGFWQKTTKVLGKVFSFVDDAFTPVFPENYEFDLDEI